MSATITSYHKVFASGEVERIEIPSYQRDYAQGRGDAKSTRIRDEFLDSLHRALTTDEPLHLDFVYGDQRGAVFVPLDGQQRLTTLALLHWYLSDTPEPRARLSYSTRVSAREFCDALAAHRPPRPVASLAEWIRDQPWFLSTWRHDPSVSAMLTMLDAIHARFRGTDRAGALARLCDTERPAVSFHRLPIEGMGSVDGLYIKMNSRGRPLTDFEVFKARFETILPEGRREEFSKKIDGDWADALWPMRGDDDLIDDEFMRYLHFIVEVCEWREGAPRPGDLFARASALFGAENREASENITFLFKALDTWVGVEAKDWFESHFALDRHEPGKLTLFKGNDEGYVDLLNACCRHYGDRSKFSIARTVLLDAVLIHRVETTPDFARRIRTLRNLVEASQDTLRAEYMPELIEGVRAFVRDGQLGAIKRLNKRQLDEERAKEKLLIEQPALAPTLHRLEDHHLLRGCLAAFALDAGSLATRAEAFAEAFEDGSQVGRIRLSAALLACGDYGRPFYGGYRFQYGSPAKSVVWRELLTDADAGRVRAPLCALLDRLSALSGSVSDRLAAVSDEWLRMTEATGEFDWRYHLVRYSAMRDGQSGVYVSEDPFMGYSLCMLWGERLNGYYRDPYLLAISQAARAPDDRLRNTWFRGYAHEARWMELAHSGCAMRCERAHIALRAPTNAAKTDAFERVCAKYGVGAELKVAIPQVSRGGAGVDTLDRVKLGAELLRELLDAGL